VRGKKQFSQACHCEDTEQSEGDEAIHLKCHSDPCPESFGLAQDMAQDDTSCQIVTPPKDGGSQ